MSECFVNRFDSRSVLTKSHRQVVKANEKSLKRKRGLLAVMHLVLVNKSNADVLSWTARTEEKKQKKRKNKSFFCDRRPKRPDMSFASPLYQQHCNKKTFTTNIVYTEVFES